MLFGKNFCHLTLDTFRCLQKLCWEFALKQSSLFLEIIVNLDWWFISSLSSPRSHVSCFVKYPSRPRKNVWGKTLKQNQQTEAVLGCLAVLCSALLKLQGSTKFFHVWKWGDCNPVVFIFILFSTYLSDSFPQLQCFRFSKYIASHVQWLGNSILMETSQPIEISLYAISLKKFRSNKKESILLLSVTRPIETCQMSELPVEVNHWGLQLAKHDCWC